ncbi:enoyl-CoA hydratase/isomerase family protein [Spiractinospora alimapuensis]|uniref:enoyl-CoA hydratase/isomerase family protein n=1 Tax=Spiractinospora alimapuensis TaxID=2820884 RepID=UPI001F3D5FC2|nr:enoyl-CoA hydratase/isomerase family protein [Spiractinospora alimapuensis]QVQ52440.1 enoyl-CoA hydratase/isomerase family protein [Spiractinospora alimapuensis]
MDFDLESAGLRLHVDDAAARVTLDRPERRNAMTPRMWRALAHIGHTLPPTVRIVVFEGAGKSFSTGLDLSVLEGADEDGRELVAAASADTPENRARLDAMIAGFQEGFTWLRRPDIVSIAAVHGHALGAGFQLALSCDIRVLAEDATMSMREAALGLVPDLTGTKPLVERVGLSRAIELCLTARNVGAREAERLGLAEIVVDGPDLAGTVDDLVAALLATPAPAASATKRLLMDAAGNTLSRQSEAERLAQVHRLLALFANE